LTVNISNGSDLRSIKCPSPGRLACVRRGMLLWPPAGRGAGDEQDVHILPGEAVGSEGELAWLGCAVFAGLWGAAGEVLDEPDEEADAHEAGERADLVVLHVAQE